MAGEQVTRILREQTIEVAPEFRMVTPIEESDVNLFDYDGTLLASYTKEEFANLTEYPAGGNHDGLTPCGWNWPLADAKAWVARVGWLDIGYAYKPTDGKTHIFAELPDTIHNPQFGLAVNGEATIDWGDGTTDTLTGTSTTTTKWTDNHEYATGGLKEIKISVTGSAALIGTTSSTYLRHVASSSLNNYYVNSIRGVWIGENMQPGNYCFAYLRYAREIVLPPTATLCGTYCGAYSVSIPMIVLPDGLLTISDYCGYSSGARIIFPKSATTGGNYLLSNVSTMSRVALVASGTSYTSSVSMANNRIERIAYGNDITTIGNVTGANVLEIILPEALTALPASFVASSLARLEKITIPASVTSMGTGCFQNCNGLKELHFKGTTPPTTNTNCFNSFPSRCKIFVPRGCLEAYTTANRYPSPETVTYIEE